MIWPLFYTERDRVIEIQRVCVCFCMEREDLRSGIALPASFTLLEMEIVAKIKNLTHTQNDGLNHKVL